MGKFICSKCEKEKNENSGYILFSDGKKQCVDCYIKGKECVNCKKTPENKKDFNQNFTIFGEECVCEECFNEFAQKKIEKVIITTTNNIDGFMVKEYIGVESVEIVIGTGLFSELSSEITDFWGMRSSVFENKLQNAKTKAMELIKMKAAERNADAVIGTDVDYTEFSGNRIGIVINGTFVKIKKIEKDK